MLKHAKVEDIIPSVQHIYAGGLCSGLNGSNFLVGNDLADIVVGYSTVLAFANKIAALWGSCVYVVFELWYNVSKLCTSLRRRQL